MLKKFANLKNPLFQFFLYLLAFAFLSTFDLFISGSGQKEIIQYGSNFAVTVVSALVVYYFVRFKLNFVTSNPFNFFISCLIAYLLLHPTNPWWFFVITVLSIAVGKYFVKFNNMPIFNPAALGIVLATIITRVLFLLKLAPDYVLVSWWGTDMTQQFLTKTPLFYIVAALLLLRFMYFSHKFRKLYYMATFWIVYVAFIIVYSVLTNNQSVLTINSFAMMVFVTTGFFSFVMLTEPKTSPIFSNQQIIVGILAAVFLFANNTFFASLPIDPFLNTVLAANLMVFVFGYFRKLTSGIAEG